jgi:hypothetical protein
MRTLFRGSLVVGMYAFCLRVGAAAGIGLLDLGGTRGAVVFATGWALFLLVLALLTFGPPRLTDRTRGWWIRNAGSLVAGYVLGGLVVIFVGLSLSDEIDSIPRILSGVVALLLVAGTVQIARFAASRRGLETATR